MLYDAFFVFQVFRENPKINTLLQNLKTSDFRNPYPRYPEIEVSTVVTDWAVILKYINFSVWCVWCGPVLVLVCVVWSSAGVGVCV